MAIDCLKTKIKPVLIEWVDSAGKSGWMSSEEAKEHEIAHVFEVGYILREDERQITLCSAMSVNPDCELVDGVMSIPKQAVLSIKKLMVDEDGN